jgi:hypothetical protein
MTKPIANRIAMRARREGWNEVFGRVVQEQDVIDAYAAGTHEHESFASFVLNEAEEYGVTHA